MSTVVMVFLFSKTIRGAIRFIRMYEECYHPYILQYTECLCFVYPASYSMFTSFEFYSKVFLIFLYIGYGFIIFTSRYSLLLAQFNSWSIQFALLCVIPPNILYLQQWTWIPMVSVENSMINTLIWYSWNSLASYLKPWNSSIQFHVMDFFINR